MKSKIYLLSFLALALLISSCGTLSITQKRYSRGLNVDLFATKDAKPVEQKAKVATKKGSDNQTIIAENTVNSTPEIINNEVVTINEIAVTTESKTTVPQKPLVKAFKKFRKAKKQPTIISKQENTNSVTKQNHSNSTKKTNETSLIVLVILSLFPILCLIAVYLHDDGVTTNFWIDLLLHLTFAGEIIYALLVVLDIIDLS